MTLPSLTVALATGAVGVVLVLGLANMLRGGSPSLSQKLMRWRVGLQGLAIALIFVVLWFKG